MRALTAIVACVTILVTPAVHAQGKPGGGQGKPGAGAPPAVERQRDQARDRDSEEERERDRQREEQRNREQQERQKACQQEAQNKELKGEQHQRFMQGCMGNTPDRPGWDKSDEQKQGDQSDNPQTKK